MKNTVRFLSLDWEPIGEFRYGQHNVSYQAKTTSHLYNAPIVFVLSFFADQSCALGVFSSDSLSETDRYANISTFTYDCEGVFKFTKKQAKEILKDIEWTVDTVDKYAESWQEESMEGTVRHTWYVQDTKNFDNDTDIYLCKGSHTKCLSYYRRNGGERRGLHLFYIA
jgi:uncharacterized Rmd1/YagE family protein